MEKYFMMQTKRTNGTFEKGAVVKDTLDEIKQAYHAYLGAYGYNHDANTDYVQCFVTNIEGEKLLDETWNKIPSEQPQAAQPQAE